MLKKKFKQKCSKIRGQRVAQFGKSLDFNPVSPFELDAVIPADSLRQPRHKSACCLHNLAIFMAVLMIHLNRNGQIAGHISFLFPSSISMSQGVNLKLRLWLSLYKYGGARTFSASHWPRFIFITKQHGGYSKHWTLNLHVTPKLPHKKQLD